MFCDTLVLMSNWPYVYESGPWRFVWEGGRLADVFHLEYDSPQDCIEVGNYDWETSRHTHAGYRSLESAAEEWLRDSASDYAKNLQ